MTANVLLNLVDQEHVTFHALQLSNRNDRQKKWASGSFLAKTDETCIFRLVPRRFLGDYPIIRSKRMAYLKSAQKTELIYIVFKVLRGLAFLGPSLRGTRAKFSRKNESPRRTLKTI